MASSKMLDKFKSALRQMNLDFIFAWCIRLKPNLRYDLQVPSGTSHN